MKKIIVAIDGVSSSGKSTMAKDLAKRTGYIYVDTGAMYRALALYALQRDMISDEAIDEEALQSEILDVKIEFKSNEEGVQETWLNGENVEKEIRSLEVGNAASRISAIRFVREELVRQQQTMGRDKGIVMDGRDIGTVVFPEAELKLFVTSAPEIRAERRYAELKAKGEEVNYEDVLANVKERDDRDMNRAESPLRQADDAIVLDNTNINLEEQNEVLRTLFYEKVL